MLIDTHAHLDMKDFGDDLPEVLSRADMAGVGYIITIGADMASSVRAAGLAEKYGTVYFTPGFHPHDVKDVTEADYVALRELASRKKAVAIGETGLDYHYDLSPRDAQRLHFARQINLAKDIGKPLVIHSREAEKDTIEIMRSEGAADAGGTMHCFAGGGDMARHALDMGFYISVGGTLTFKKADELRETVKAVPIERILLETDCPYLAPHPLRGKRNEPSYLAYIVDVLAGLKGLSTDDIARITTHNALTLFGVEEANTDAAIAYPIRDSLYLNITNRCTNACSFCARNTTDFVKGHNLRLGRDPELSEILASMEGFEKYREVVFCGYGEPFLRLDIIKAVSAHVKEKGVRVRVRVNTNGHALMIHKRDILPEIAGLVDALSVSLNSPYEEQYIEICHPLIGAGSYESLKEFVRRAKKYVPEVVVTALSMPGVDLAACRKVAEEELGVHLRVREYDEVG